MLNWALHICELNNNKNLNLLTPPNRNFVLFFNEKKKKVCQEAIHNAGFLKPRVSGSYGSWDCRDFTSGFSGWPMLGTRASFVLWKEVWSCVLSQTAVSWSLICLKTICATGSFCKHHSAWLKASRAFGRGKRHRDWERHKWARKRMELWRQVCWLWPHLSWARPVIIAAALKAALRVPILPDFLKLSPGFIDSAKTNCIYPNKGIFLRRKKSPSSEKVYQTRAKEIRYNWG